MLECGISNLVDLKEEHEAFGIGVPKLWVHRVKFFKMAMGGHVFFFHVQPM